MPNKIRFRELKVHLIWRLKLILKTGDVPDGVLLDAIFGDQESEDWKYELLAGCTHWQFIWISFWGPIRSKRSFVCSSFTVFHRLVSFTSSKFCPCRLRMVRITPSPSHKVCLFKKWRSCAEVSVGEVSHSVLCLRWNSLEVKGSCTRYFLSASIRDNLWYSKYVTISTQWAHLILRLALFVQMHHSGKQRKRVQVQ